MVSLIGEIKSGIPYNQTTWYKNGQKKYENGQKKETQKVKISDIDMPFGSMVVFMVKWAIASIPALIILMILFAIFGGFFFAIFN